MSYQSFFNQSTSGLAYEIGPKYFDFLCLFQHDHTLRGRHADLHFFMNIIIYMIDTTYSTNSID